jgi:hypothetical protein
MIAAQSLRRSVSADSGTIYNDAGETSRGYLKIARH